MKKDLQGYCSLRHITKPEETPPEPKLLYQIQLMVPIQPLLLYGRSGPGSGAVGAKNILAPYLPNCHAVKDGGHYRFEDAPHTIGSVKSYFENFLVVVRALAYMLTLGTRGMWEASQMAILNAN